MGHLNTNSDIFISYFYCVCNLSSNFLKKLAVLYFCLLTKKFLIFTINLINIIANIPKKLKVVNKIDKKILFLIFKNIKRFNYGKKTKCIPHV